MAVRSRVISELLSLIAGRVANGTTPPSLFFSRRIVTGLGESASLRRLWPVVGRRQVQPSRRAPDPPYLRIDVENFPRCRSGKPCGCRNAKWANEAVAAANFAGHGVEPSQSAAISARCRAGRSVRVGLGHAELAHRRSRRRRECSAARPRGHGKRSTTSVFRQHRSGVLGHSRSWR